jgi:hypothetical protein
VALYTEGRLQLSAQVFRRTFLEYSTNAEVSVGLAGLRDAAPRLLKRSISGSLSWHSSIALAVKDVVRHAVVGIIATFAQAFSSVKASDARRFRHSSWG